jgi:predicted DNA-binding transcriptional regulator AlpA
MKTEYFLLALYEKPFLSFAETCEAIGISKQSGYNMRSMNTFPIAMLDSPLRASVQDIAEYIDQQRELAKEKVKA